MKALLFHHPSVSCESSRRADGKEINRYKNIEIPDEIKALPYADIRFDVPLAGAITFKIVFEAGVLPEVWPEARARSARRQSWYND